MTFGMPDSCNHERAKCYNSRKRGEARWRRYKCLDCGHRWTTVEVEVDAKGAGFPAETLLRAKFGVSIKQQEAILNLIEAFTQPIQESVQ